MTVGMPGAKAAPAGGFCSQVRSGLVAPGLQTAAAGMLARRARPYLAWPKQASLVFSKHALSPTEPRVTWFSQQLINGLALGSIYALIALGYTMVFGRLRFINFARRD